MLDSTLYNDSCHGRTSCNFLSDSTVYNDSCQGDLACGFVENSTIHDGSCQGKRTCVDVKNSIIGKGSCNGTGNDIGNSCDRSENITIGNNSCNMEPNSSVKVCEKCAHNVPDNACNQGITDDITEGYCMYCTADQGQGYSAVYGGSNENDPSPFSPLPSKNKKSKTNKK